MHLRVLFYNPGPYSGYLAMIFPLCLNEWLELKGNTKRAWRNKANIIWH